MQVRALCEGLDHVGVSAAAFRARVGLAEARLGDPLAWFSVDELDALITAAVQFCGDEAFGLHWAARAPLIQFDQLPILAATAPTLGAMLDGLLRFQPLLANRDELFLSVHGERAVLACEVLAVSEQGRRTRTEAMLLALQRMFYYFGQTAALRRVNIAHPRPAYGAEHERLFAAPVYFDQPRSGLEFVRSALTRPLPGRNVALHSIVVRDMEQQRERALGELSCAHQLENLLRATLPGALRQDDAARALGLSERSLRRRLREEGVTYSAVVERVRRQAVQDLRGARSVKEVAGALGYRSVSGYQRATRRWTRLTALDP